MVVLLDEIKKSLPREPSGSLTNDFNDRIHMTFVENGRAGNEQVVAGGSIEQTNTSLNICWCCCGCCY